MNASPDSRAAPTANRTGIRKILVWDAPVRVFHWLMVLSFAGAYITAESDRWRLLHVTLGYTMAGLVIFRILWGLVGTRYARFSAFVRGPGDVLRYLGALLHRQPVHYTGHNPAGAIAIVVLLTLTLLVAVSGWATDHELAGGAAEELHEVAANTMLAVVGIHIAGVLAGSWLHRENLLWAMISGRKDGRPEDGVRSAWRSVAAIMVVAVLGFWWFQWQSAPAGDVPDDQHAPASRAGDHQDDD